MPLDGTDPFAALGAQPVGGGPAADPYANAIDVGGAAPLAAGTPAAGHAIHLAPNSPLTQYAWQTLHVASPDALPAGITLPQGTNYPVRLNFGAAPQTSFPVVAASATSAAQQPIAQPAPALPSTSQPAAQPASHDDPFAALGAQPVGAAQSASHDDPFAALGAQPVGAAQSASHDDPFAALGAQPVGAAQSPGTPSPSAPLAPPNAVPKPLTGYTANIGAGANEAVTGLLGLPFDTVNNILNLVPKGINAAAGTNIPLLPTGAAHTLDTALGVVGANPENVQPATPGEALVRAAARGATGVMAAGALGGAAAPLAAGTAYAPVAEAMAQGANATGASIGAAGGVTGFGARHAVPPKYGDLADTLGNIVGGGLTAIGESALTAAGRVGQSAYQNMRGPMSIGPQETLTDPATGQPFTAAGGAPLTGTAQQQTLAGQRIAAAAKQSPAELAASIPPQGQVPSQLTLGQSTGNLGVLGLERTLRTQNREPFTIAEAANQNARLDALRGLAGPQAAGDAAGKFFAEQLAKIRALSDVLDESGRNTAKRVTEQLGGSPAEMSEQDLGAAHQAALEALRKPVKEAASRLYDAVDPDGTLALKVENVATKAKQLLAEVNPRMGGQLSGEESGILTAAAHMRPVELFSDIRALDSNISAAQRAVRNNPAMGAESPAFRRLTILRGEIDSAMAGAAKDAGARDAVAPASRRVGERLAAEADTPSAGASVFTPSGREVGVRYRVREASDLIASHDEDMRPNPKYPAELQPRDRGRAASQAQVQRIAGNIQPERLGASASAMEGAPIIGPDGVVESGNARVLGLRKAYAAAGESAAKYREWLEAQGFDAKGMQMPILVRERETAMSPQDRVRFTQEANASPGLAMSAAERAKVDAQRMPDSMLGLWNTGDVDSAANRDFVRAFVKNVAEKGEEGSFITGEGGISLEGAQRIRNALLQRAYGDPNLVSALVETGDDNIKAFGGALMDAAGDFAKLRQRIAAGEVDPGTDITPRLLDAAGIISQARLRRISIKDAVGQTDAFAPAVNPLTESVLRAAYGDNLTGRMSRQKMADLLSFYAEEAGKQTTAPRLFGENLSPAAMIEQGNARSATGQSIRPSRPASRSSGYGPSNGEVGSENGGLGNGAPGQGNAEPSQAANANLAASPLTPNFSPSDAATLRTANAAYRDYKQTWRQGTIGKVLATANTESGLKMPAAQVARNLFRPGTAGATAADDLIKAAGSPEAATALLGDYPAYAFRRAAERDGAIDPKLADKWIAANKDALKKFPGMAARFGTAADATRAWEDTAAKAQSAIKAYQDTAGGHYLNKAGEVVEPQAAIGKLMASPTAPADAAALMKAAQGDAAATDGIKRNLVDFLIQRTRSQAEAGVTGQKEIAGATFQKFVSDSKNAAVIRTILGNDGAKLVTAIGKDIEQAARSVNATKIPGSPGTAADLHALADHGGEHPSVVGQVIIGEALGEAAGHMLHLAGPVGSAVRVATTLGTIVGQHLRTAGMRKVDDLATYGVLNPELGRLLLSKVPVTAKSPIIHTLLARIGQVGLSGAATHGP